MHSCSTLFLVLPQEDLQRGTTLLSHAVDGANELWQQDRRSILCAPMHLVTLAHEVENLKGRVELQGLDQLEQCRQRRRGLGSRVEHRVVA